MGRSARPCAARHDTAWEDHLWHSISQGVREARRTHGLKHLAAQAGPSSLEEAELERSWEAVPAHERSRHATSIFCADGASSAFKDGSGHEAASDDS